ncbi:MAG: TlpA family protein disulfide reductase, partial [Bacteroidota bacterium]
AMAGNCGCFGQLIPMTPLEAFVKNILTLGILIFIYLNVSDRPKGENNFLVPFNIWLASTFMIFILIPYCPCPCKESMQGVAAVESEVMDVTEPESNLVSSDSSQAVAINSTDTLPNNPATTKTDTVVAVPGPKKVKSRFSAQNIFDGKKVDINDGKKIICFFAPGCDHCQDAAKELAKLSKNPEFPRVYIYFIEDEVDKIPDFHKIANKQFPSKVIAPGEFWTLFGPSGSTPGIHYLWNGNVIQSFEGTGENAFTAAKLKAVVESNKSK